MTTSWRITVADFASAAFKGEGSRLFGGRWTSPGLAVVYTSSSAALAALEILVHAKRKEVMRKYVLFACTFDASLVEPVDRGKLPKDWRTSPAPPALQQIGDRWSQEGRSAILQVPSAVIETETNYLLNPSHPDFPKVEIAEPMEFSLDTRLLR